MNSHSFPLPYTIVNQVSTEMTFPEFPHLFFAMLNQSESIKCRTATFFLSLFECKKILSGKTLAIKGIVLILSFVLMNL